MEKINMLINTKKYGTIVIGNVKSVSWEEEYMVIEHFINDKLHSTQLSLNEFDTFSFEKQEKFT